MTKIRYYLCRLRFNGDVTFVVWVSDDVDTFLRDADSRLRTASTAADMAEEVRKLGVVLENEEPSEYDFDRIEAWIRAPNAEAIDCREFLLAWNFFDDLAGLHQDGDTPYTRLSRRAAVCYDKLFWGNNLPAITPPGERYEPTWSKPEIYQIRRVMEAGIELLAAELERGASNL